MVMAAAAPEPPHLCLWCCNRPRLQSDTGVVFYERKRQNQEAIHIWDCTQGRQGDFWINAASFVSRYMSHPIKSKRRNLSHKFSALLYRIHMDGIIKNIVIAELDVEKEIQLDGNGSRIGSALF